MYQPVTRCRVCGNGPLVPILDLGHQYLTGVFPRHPGAALTRGPLELVKCHGDAGGAHCGLVQLGHSYDSTELYGDNYGYRSSLNRSMVEHLDGIARRLLEMAPVGPGDFIVDIGSNDGTLLSRYPPNGATRVGIDPTAAKFERFYDPAVIVLPEFFSADGARAVLGHRKATIVTSIAMFYDLEEPIDFMRQVAEILADDGLWHLEQSYLASMLAANAYDTICHEHLEYYTLRQIDYMARAAGLKIVDVALNDVNGGSLAVTVARSTAAFPEAAAPVASIVAAEDRMGLGTLTPYQRFRERVLGHREELLALLDRLERRGDRVLGYGASTKGNVILQFCGLTTRHLPAIAEVNEDKFGCVTPGSWIPIVSEVDAHAAKPDYFLVLPWHFRSNLLQREKAFLRAGGGMVFPLPSIEVVREEGPRSR
jgi:hypothetical protein